VITYCNHTVRSLILTPMPPNPPLQRGGGGICSVHVGDSRETRDIPRDALLGAGFRRDDGNLRSEITFQNCSRQLPRVSPYVRPAARIGQEPCHAGKINQLACLVPVEESIGHRDRLFFDGFLSVCGALIVIN